MKLPYGAFECCLEGIEPVNDQWSPEATAYFATATGQSKLTLKVVEKNADLMKVELLVNGSSSINDMMVSQGFAKRIGAPAVALKSTKSTIVEAEGDPSTVVVKKNQIRGYKVMAGLSCDGTVVHLGDPQKFYMHIYSTDFIATLADLTKKIAAYVVNETEPYLPKCQEMVIAKWQEEWFRAAVLSVQDPQQIQVHFIDYGNDDFVPVRDVRRFSSEFVTPPAMAITCCLANIHPPAGRVNEQQVSLYNSLVQVDKMCLMKVIYSLDESAGVELYEKDNPDVCINQDLARLQSNPALTRKTFTVDKLAKSTLIINEATGVSIGTFTGVDLFLNPISSSGKMIIDPF
jgi:hypothetical protein